MARASKDCIFCGRSPTTSEHIWAKWLRKHIAMPLLSHSAAASILNPDRTVTIDRRRWGGDPRQRGLQVVCKRCNETWMSSLQEAAKPVLVPLIEGRRCVLAEDRQRAVAAWAAMAITCAEYFQPQRTAVSVVARRFSLGSSLTSHLRT
jgi:hypothetical protein